MPGAGRSRWLRWRRPGRAARPGVEFELATRLAAIVESSGDSIVSATLNGVVTSWNAAAERMYGYAAGEIIGRSTSLLIPPDTVAELMPILQRVRQPAQDLPAIDADRGQVEQVLLNLAINARDAMPRGGTLTITTSLAELRDGDGRLHPGSSPGRYAELAVADTGTGMSPQTAARIFEPFFTTKPPDQGTGLGLSTVYGIITQAGGHLDVETAEGAGTTFRLYFPATGQAAAAAPAASSRPPAAAPGKR